MRRLTEETWFTEKWATEVRDATRDLTRLYFESLESIAAFPGFLRRVKLYGLRGGYRPLLVLKSFLHEVAVDHIRTILRHLEALQLRAFAASRPRKLELSLGVKRTAESEVVEAAEIRRGQFIEQQQRIAVLLQEAAEDVRSLADLLVNEERAGQRALKGVLRLLRRGLPFLWAGWAVAQFQRLQTAPQLQVIFFFLVTVLVYHAMALTTLLFHDAGERKYILFDGYMGKSSDGLSPLSPPASQFEQSLFKKFGVNAPVVISWETIVPILHYVVISVLIVWLWVRLPQGVVAREVIGVFGLILIATYFRRLVLLQRLLMLRYRGRSRWEILHALFTSFQPLLPIEEDNDKGNGENEGDQQ